MMNVLLWLLYGATIYVTVFLLLVFLEGGELKPEVKWLEEWPTITLVIPAYNEEESIGMTIESCLSVDYPRDKMEVIVVDDGSTDRTEKRAREYEKNDVVKVISQENKGKGGALNTGLENASSEYMACVDADSRIMEESLKNMVSQFDEDTAAIASAMKAYEPSNMVQKVQWFEYIVGIFTRSIMSIINAIHVTPGPLSVYRRHVIEDVGGFDEKSLVEDQEICFRLQKNQWKVKSSRKGEVYTIVPKNFKELYHQRKRWYRGSIENLLKYRGMMLNSNYGDFGYFGLTSKILTGLLSMLAVLIITYVTALPIYNFLHNLYNVGLMSFISNASSLSIGMLLDKAYWGIISMRFTSILMISTMFLISASMAYMAAQHTEEKVLKQGVIPTFIYLAWYVLFVGLMYMIVLFEMIFDIEAKW